MKHCVFCAAKIDKNMQAITSAIMIKEALEEQWELEHDCVLMAYHSKFSIIDETSNTSIYLENDDATQLICDCMEFAAERIKNRILTKIKSIMA